MLLQTEDPALVKSQPLPHRISILNRGVKGTDPRLVAMDDLTVDVDLQVLVALVVSL